MAKIIAAAKRHNKFLGRPGGSPEKIREYYGTGIPLLSRNQRAGLMTNGAKSLLEPFGEKGHDAAERMRY